MGISGDQASSVAAPEINIVLTATYFYKIKNDALIRLIIPSATFGEKITNAYIHTFSCHRSWHEGRHRS